VKTFSEVGEGIITGIVCFPTSYTTCVGILGPWGTSWWWSGKNWSVCGLTLWSHLYLFPKKRCLCALHSKFQADRVSVTSYVGEWYIFYEKVDW